MESNAYAYLLPSIGEMFSGTPAGVSAIVWLIMYGFLMYAGNYVLTRYFRAKKTIKLVGDFKEALDENLRAAGEFANELADERNTRHLALNLRDMVSNLTPHPSYNPNNKDDLQIQYTSSTQLDYYLNARELMPDLFDNKFVGFVPSLMTGFGVLGTFIGIQLGIGGLEFNVDDIENVTKLKLNLNFSGEIKDRGVLLNIDTCSKLNGKIDFESCNCMIGMALNNIASGHCEITQNNTGSYFSDSKVIRANAIQSFSMSYCLVGIMGCS